MSTERSMRPLGIIDFDDIDGWAPHLAATLRPNVPRSVEGDLVQARPKYVEDARELLLDLTDRDAVIDAALDWLYSTMIAGYHGSRLTSADVASIREVGLLPLKAETRRDRLIRALSPHPRWPEVAPRLDAAIHAHGQAQLAGSREGQVHLTLSKAGLASGFDHYLTHGAEFDQHVAHALLGPEGTELLAYDGAPMVIKLAVPGTLALAAAHPFFPIDYLRRRGEVPNIVNQFLESWSYRLAHSGFQSRTLKVDCGMIFKQTVPAAWILDFEAVHRWHNPRRR